MFLLFATDTELMITFSFAVAATDGLVSDVIGVILMSFGVMLLVVL